MERKRKRELRELNARAWNGEEDVFPVGKSLDSSMKKNTGFIKRLRTGITAQSLDIFIQEVKTVSLHKYLSEVISACYEGLCRLKTPGEITAGVEVMSALHQRFGPKEFTGYLGWHVGRGLATPDRAQLKALSQEVREREEKERLSRQRVLLRVATELWLVDVLRSLDDVIKPEELSVRGKENSKAADVVKAKGAPNGAKAGAVDVEPFPLEVLKDMLGHDREHVNLPLVVLFVKTFAWDVLGVKVASEARKTVLEDGATVESAVKAAEELASTDEDEARPRDPPITSPELQQRFKNILQRYFDDVKAHIVRDQKNLVNQSRRNAEAYVKSGEVFEDRQANYERQARAQEKLTHNAQILSDALGTEMPDLREKDSSAAAGDGSIGLVKAGEYLRGQGDGPGIWEDEEERRFYENLLDLKDRVPGILLEDGKKKKADGDEQVGKKNDNSETNGEASPASAKAGDADDQSTAIANKSVGAQVDALLARLPEFTSKEMVDQTAMDFCFLNSKASRNRLVKTIQEIPKGRTDLLPLYSRLVATLGRYMPDIVQGIVTYLDDEFRSLQRRKSKDFLGQVRTANVRYLAELTKFGTVPEHVIFHCLKVGLDDFSRMNIEIICHLLENCGRYLLRNPETAPRMSSFLETLQRKKSASHIGQQERMLVENAIYYVNPPERTAIQQKERSPIDLFLRKLIYIDLSKRNLDQIVKQIRKLHWEEQEVVKILSKIFSKPGKIRYGNIDLLAVILGSLNRYHQDFCISVIDDLLESITFGLELNDFKFNQRRIAEVKYLSELYVYRMVDSPVIFDTLYRIVTYGHDGGIPKPAQGNVNPLDLPDDYFRIRLVCTMLEGCCIFFNKGAGKKKLDFFLSFFQYYIQTKHPLPMDMEFVVQDAFAAARPQWKILTNLEDAGKAFAAAVKQNYDSPAAAVAAEAEEMADEDENSDDDSVHDEEDHVTNHAGEEEQALSGDDAAAEADDGLEGAEQESDGEEEEEERIVVTRPEEERDPELDADFDRELAKMMAESLGERKTERKTMFDLPLPLRRAPRDTVREPTGADDSGDEKPNGQAGGTMKFSLLSRKGNRQQTRSIDLPSDSNFAVAMRTQQEAERAEQQRIKSLVLNLDLRDENDADGDYSDFHLPPRTNDSNAFVLRPNPNHSNRLGVLKQQRQQRRAGAVGKPSTTANGSAQPEPPATRQVSLAELMKRRENQNQQAKTTDTASLDKSPFGANVPGRVDKAGNNRSTQRARKLQLSDVDWYGRRPPPAFQHSAFPA